MVWNGYQPTPGVDVPAGSTVAVWNPTNGDIDIHNYTLQADKSILYTPPTPPPPGPPMPDLINFELSVFGSPQVSPTAKIMLPLTFAVLDTNIGKPDLVKAYWSTLLATSSAQFGLDSTTISAVEALATQFNVPLI